ncbi:nicotinate-nucleotide adenylyltransferase [Lactobacillus sp. DCY120]|uniref:Probable nicotinate-nucleotide adenylyltransferase n=1 Tax=Bombilactobacillus apium TaxID=2675299 RepID=A0A850R866_9LACO|nr:nicotinate-nucleotide adenylyltransferase [Bombilactobacillus apium]NVY96902.1 nicotinate-nucleotide adenylyltransferase [Bombilactobacillus apium]
MTKTVLQNRIQTDVQVKPASTSSTHRIGILGGTFNPPHIGHLMMADQVYQQLGLEKIIFIPDAQPPHIDRKETLAVQDRVEMVQRAILDHPQFELGLMEVQRGGISYTCDTLQQLHQAHPENQYYLIIGGDMVNYLPKWHQIEKIVQLAQLVGVCRKGYEKRSTYPLIWVNMPTSDVSSTWIRQTVQTGGSIRYFVPEAVRQYIQEKGLYLKDEH